MKYACIDRRRNRYPVRMMCGLLTVSRSGYYAWRARPESPRTKRDRVLRSKIRRIHAKSDGVYGSPRIHAELVAAGVRVGRHKVARLMRLERLRGCPKRRFRVTTQRNPSHPVAQNLLKRNFSDLHRNVVLRDDGNTMRCAIRSAPISTGSRSSRAGWKPTALSRKWSTT